MKLVFSPQAREDHIHWQTADPKTHERINETIKRAARTPHKGIGQPEPLKHNLKGWRSRRITKEDRMAYRASGKGGGQALELAQLRFHYR